MFQIRIDASECTSILEGLAHLDKTVYDYWITDKFGEGNRVR